MKPVYLVIDRSTKTSDVAAWIEAHEVRVLNVAGNRESTETGIGERVERFLMACSACWQVGDSPALPERLDGRRMAFRDIRWFTVNPS